MLWSGLCRPGRNLAFLLLVYVKPDAPTFHGGRLHVATLPPVFHLDVWYLLKISAIAREQRPPVYQDNRGDLEVHRADTNSLLP